MERKDSKIDVSSLNHELFTFLQQPKHHPIHIPQCLQPHSEHFAFVVIFHLLPMVQEIDMTGKQQKKVVADCLQNIILNCQDHLSQLYNLCAKECAGTVSFVDILMKFINMPSKLINMLSESGTQGGAIKLSKVDKYSDLLFEKVLKESQKLSQNQKILVVNKLGVLNHQGIIIDYMIQGQKQKYFIDNFHSWSKQNNLIKNIYCRYIQSIKQNSRDTRQRYEQLMKELVDRHHQLSSAFVSLLNSPQKQIFQGQLYVQYYHFISNTGIKLPIFEELLRWWSASRNYIITQVHSQIRCNILALFIRNCTKEFLMESDHTPCIIEGIKKRLTDGSSKAFALLIWKVLAEVAKLPTTPEAEQADLFVIRSNVVVHHLGSEKVEGKNEIHSEQKEQVVVQKISTGKVEQKHEDSESEEEEEGDMVKIEPKNIYDCILGLRIPQRSKTVLKKLPSLIKAHKQDLALMWNSLLQNLLSPLKKEYKPVLVLLFTSKPEDFIETLPSCFKQKSIAEKINLMEIIDEAIEELSTIQEEDEKDESQSEFYFKKVKSKYYSEEEPKKEREKERDERSRRWGHTRIAHQNKARGVSLNIVKQSYPNRFYPVASIIYYKVIDLLSIDLVGHLRKHQIFVHLLLKLLSTFSSHIKNHFEKNILLTDIAGVCRRVIEELLSAREKSDNRYEETGGQTLMLCLQVVNKISLALDKYASNELMLVLKEVVEKGRRLPNYGMSNILDLIESNIFKNVYSQFTLNI